MSVSFHGTFESSIPQVFPDFSKFLNSSLVTN